jgi:hypothetical protein
LFPLRERQAERSGGTANSDVEQYKVKIETPPFQRTGAGMDDAARRGWRIVCLS